MCCLSVLHKEDEDEKNEIPFSAILYIKKFMPSYNTKRSQNIERESERERE